VVRINDGDYENVMKVKENDETIVIGGGNWNYLMTELNLKSD
jgi:peptidase E